jgi:hypothetical protein
LTRPTLLANGSFQFGFTNLSGVPFTALATTNLTLPSSNWTVLGPATEILPGQFQFTAPPHDQIHFALLPNPFAVGTERRHSCCFVESILTFGNLA